MCLKALLWKVIKYIKVGDSDERQISIVHRGTDPKQDLYPNLQEASKEEPSPVV